MEFHLKFFLPNGAQFVFVCLFQFMSVIDVAYIQIVFLLFIFVYDVNTSSSVARLIYYKTKNEIQLVAMCTDYVFHERHFFFPYLIIQSNMKKERRKKYTVQRNVESFHGRDEILRLLFIDCFSFLQLNIEHTTTYFSEIEFHIQEYCRVKRYNAFENVSNSGGFEGY